MGSVYVATQEALGREVAIKLIKEEFSNRENVAERFRREAQAIAALNHPNIVTIHDFGKTQDGILYITMEFIAGLSLSQCIRRNGHFSWQQSIPIIRDVAMALQAAHGANILHRDLKPDNIMLSMEGSVVQLAKVLDFGVAKLLSPGDGNETLTQDGMVVGTPAYMAPEVVMEGEIGDLRSDLFALGLIWYELLMGKKMRRASTATALLVEAVNGPTPDIHEECTHQEVPEDIAQMIYRLLEKSPDKRYQTTSDLISDLQTLQSFKHGKIPNLEPPAGSTQPTGVTNKTRALLDSTDTQETIERPIESIASKPQAKAVSSVPIEGQPRTRMAMWLAIFSITSALVLMIIFGNSKQTTPTNETDGAKSVTTQTANANPQEKPVSRQAQPPQDEAPPLVDQQQQPGAIVSKTDSEQQANQTAEPIAQKDASPAQVEPSKQPADIKEPPKVKKKSAAKTPKKKKTRKPDRKAKAAKKKKDATLTALTSDDIEDAIIRNLGPATKCFNTNITRPRTGRGLLVDHCPSYKSSDVAQRILLTIRPDGSIVNARFKSPKTNQTKIGACVLKSVKSWKFPKFASKEPVTVSQKIGFKPCVPINNKCVFRKR